ncbi:MAG: GNAT family N-acetyltransferase [Nitrospirae bacterium]|nr:GNAT family N-acetyltransferase [Nitrospirota bacterium]
MGNETFRFELLDGPEAFSRLEGGWECLCDELADHVTAFASHTWYQSWWTYYSSMARLHLFTMWQGDKLVGIAPLMWKKSSLHGLPVRMIGFIQNNQSLHNDFIVTPEHRTFFLQELIHSLFEQSSSWDIIYLRNISLVSNNYKSLEEILAAEGKSWKRISNPIDSPYLIPSGSWSDYFAGRTRKTRKNLKHIRNKIYCAGKVSVKNIRTWEEFLSCKEDMFDVAQQSWSERVGDSLGSPLNRDFFESLAFRAAAKGWLSIWALYLDGKMIAVEFHLKAYGREHAMRGHYHPEFASLSPGTYLEMTILEHVFEEQERVRVYDFCGSFDSYKKKWTDTSVPHGDIYVFKEQLYSKAAFFYEFNIVSGIMKAVRYAKRRLLQSKP